VGGAQRNPPFPDTTFPPISFPRFAWECSQDDSRPLRQPCLFGDMSEKMVGSATLHPPYYTALK